MRRLLLSLKSPLIPLDHGLLWLTRLLYMVYLSLGYARYLETDKSGKVTEEMIDCMPIKSTKADSFFEVIDDSSRKRGINIATLKCVSFDGAAVMSSPVNGFNGRMMVRWELPHLVCQHCQAHRLQLVGRDAAKNSPQAELALGYRTYPL